MRQEKYWNYGVNSAEDEPTGIVLGEGLGLFWASGVGVGEGLGEAPGLDVCVGLN
jgi:hypothetical protein